MDSPWYTSFFNGIGQEIWCAAVSPAVTSLEADFVEANLGVMPGERLIDVPCGRGRHTIELASRGYIITSVDIIDDSIKHTEQAVLANALSEQVNILRADMSDFDTSEEHDGAFCLGNSFGYVDARATQGFFDCVARSLKRGARFILDTEMTAETVFVVGGEREWVQVGDIYMMTNSTYNPVTSTLDTDFTFIKQGKVETSRARHWIFTVGQICHMLGNAGLQPVQLYGSLEGDEFTLGAPRLLLIAQKD